jgi:hypothetical protein
VPGSDEAALVIRVYAFAKKVGEYLPPKKEEEQPRRRRSAR